MGNRQGELLAAWRASRLWQRQKRSRQHPEDSWGSGGGQRDRAQSKETGSWSLQGTPEESGTKSLQGGSEAPHVLPEAGEQSRVGEIHTRVSKTGSR